MPHFLRLSPVAGINMDTVLTWTEGTTSLPETLLTTTGPRQTYRYDVPCIRVECLGGACYTYTGEEREAFLAYVDAVPPAQQAEMSDGNAHCNQPIDIRTLPMK